MIAGFKIPPLLCLEHSDSFISGVCEYRQCKSTYRSYCEECRQKHHPSHTDQYNHQRYLKNQENDKKIQDMLLQIEQSSNQLKMSFKQIQTVVKPLEEIKNVNELEAFIRYKLGLQQLIEEEGLEKQVNSLKRLCNFVNSNMTTKSMEIQIKSKQFTQLIQNQQQNNEEYINDSSEENSLNDNPINLCKSGQNIVDSQVTNCQSYVRMKNLENNVLHILHEFNSEYKSDQIKLSENNQIAEGQYFVLFSKKANHDQQTKFGLEILECKANDVFIGACNQTIVAQNQYRADFSKRDQIHGAYLISSNGDIFTNININDKFQEKNGKPQKKIKFSKGDIVFVTINDSRTKIYWNTSKEPNKYFILQTNDEEELFPCVYLLNNAKVKIQKEIN